MTASPLTTDSIDVKITASSDDAGAAHYLTTTTEDSQKTCQGLNCVLNELEPAKKYTVVSKACLTETDGCSDPVEDVTWTKPTRTHRSLYYNLRSDL